MTFAPLVDRQIAVPQRRSLTKQEELPHLVEVDSSEPPSPSCSLLLLLHSQLNRNYQLVVVMLLLLVVLLLVVLLVVLLVLVVLVLLLLLWCRCGVVVVSLWCRVVESILGPYVQRMTNITPVTSLLKVHNRHTEFLHEMRTSTLSQETTITRYSRVIMNCSNCKGRGRQACPSLYGPAPGARLPSDTTPHHTTALSPSPRRAPRQMHQDRRHTTSPTSLRAALPMINQSLLVGDLKLHSGELTRRLLPELCRKRSTRNPVGGPPLREPTPLQPQHSTLDVQGHCRNIRQ